MKPTRLIFAFAAFVGITATSFAESGKEIIIEAPPEPAPYEAGRGLITLQGPTGMFINPTSATLPKNAFTVQYCLFSPNVDSSVIGHGLLACYGITDWLEFSLLGSYVDIRGGDDPTGVEPHLRVRLLKNDGFIPQISAGYYGRFGDAPLEFHTAYAAGYNRLPIDENGIFKSLGFHYGVRNGGTSGLPIWMSFAATSVSNCSFPTASTSSGKSAPATAISTPRRPTPLVSSGVQAASISAPPRCRPEVWMTLDSGSGSEAASSSDSLGAPQRNVSSRAAQAARLFRA